ncbi:MAG: DoxX family membrane protein [Nanoarchaeota archaeon]|nr:DoxX family membrane protein [Nanoarchaeota archaeon]
MKLPENAKEWSPVLLRIGLSLVFLWFGASQLMNPNNFVGYLPTFLFASSMAKAFVLANGIFEIIAGLLLLGGLFTRIVSFLLALHLMVITIELGMGETAVRDFGLSIATLAVCLGGYDSWSIDYYRKKKR